MDFDFIGCRFNRAQVVNKDSSIVPHFIGRSLSSIYYSDRDLRFLSDCPILQLANFYGQVGAELAAGVGSGLRKSPNQQPGAESRANQAPEGIRSSVFGSISGLPLGAKIALTFVIALFAAPVMFRGFVGISDRGYNRAASFAYLYGSLTVIGGWAFLIGWVGRG